jgi:hypothetical protein
VAATRPGFLGAALAIGRTIAKIVSASLGSARIAERLAMAWPNMSAWFMRAVADSLGGELAAARWLFAGLAVLTVIGTIGSFRTVGR